MRNFRRFLRENKNLKPPVDIKKIIENLGVSLDFKDLGKIDGMCVELKGQWHIVIKNTMPKVRQRFTMAHELKHFLEKENACAIETKQEYKIEAEANQFAGSLLVSRYRLKYYWDKYEDINKVARRFNVSSQVIKIRLKRIGVYI